MIKPATSLASLKFTSPTSRWPLFLLGVRKKGDDTFELAVYAKDKEPHLLLPLQKIDTKQELPIEMEAMKGDNETGVITLSILGKYRAKLTVGKQE